MPFVFDPSLNCFFNALIREWSGWHYRAVNSEDTIAPALEPGNVSQPIASNTRPMSLSGWFDISDGQETLSIPCMHFSSTGRHHLLSPCQLSSSGEPPLSLAFPAALEWVMRNNTLSEKVNPEMVGPFIARALQSDYNLKEAMAFRQADLPQLFSQPLSFPEAESALFTGHSIHPCPKARDNFSQQDTLNYAPEFEGTFPLNWYRVKRNHLYTCAAQGFDYQHMLEELINTDAQVHHWAQTLATDETLFPCHPFQHQAWQSSMRIQTLISQEQLCYLGQGDMPWSATTSVRAIYSAQSPWMLKFSLSVKLTNSIRHLQPEELVRGAELCRVLQTPPAQEFIQRFPTFQVLNEPTAASLCGNDGQPFEESIVLWRENPFINGNQNNTEVLATLLQDDPRSGESRLEQCLKRRCTMTPAKRYLDIAHQWFDRYLNIAVKPLLIAQADYGLLFGAHQQNIVLTLADDMPIKMYFRDCQGTGFSQLSHELYKPFLPDMAQSSGNVLEDTMAIRLFSYYLIINATFNVISSLSRSGEVAEADLIGQLRQFLTVIKEQGVRDTQCIDYLLHAPELSAKGNFFVALRQLNENTETDYLDMYHPMPNPLTQQNHH